MVPTTFISWIYHFWAQFWPYFNFADFRANFGHFSLVKKGKYKMPNKQQKMASNKKNARKQTHSKIQFYMGIHVTSFDFGHFLLWWSYSTCPIVQVVEGALANARFWKLGDWRCQRCYWAVAIVYCTIMIQMSLFVLKDQLISVTFFFLWKPAVL